MSDSEQYVRTGSGVWKLVERSTQAPAPAPAPPPRPPPAFAASTPTPAPRGQPRALPKDPFERSRMLASLAREELARGALAQAEVNFRMAHHFAPADRHLEAELKRVVEAREQSRRSRPHG